MTRPSQTVSFERMIFLLDAGRNRRPYSTTKLNGSQKQFKASR
jgi:hypothetical protein